MKWAEGYIAVDWGTTNRRAYRLDASGKNVDEFEDHKGVLSVPDGGFPAAVAEIRQRLGDYPLLLAGMVGSSRGWKEAPYVACPAGLDELAAALVWAGEREAIVPGVSYVGSNRADVMRGEEVQLLGAVVAGLVDPMALISHPGTHNKWVTLRHGKIADFRTVMTGEVFSLLKQHSILSDLLQGEVEPNEAFKEAAHRALDDGALTADLFSVRARVLLGQARKEDAASYASGLLIGSDVRIGLSTPAAANVTIIGRPDLTRLYAAAIEQAQRSSRELDGERCFLAGIQEIAKESMIARELLQRHLGECPLVAIVRGVTPGEADAIGEAIYESGIRIIEVPLNSPDPLDSIARLAKQFGERMLVGAGTVLDPADVQRVRDAGGRIVVSPDSNVEVISATAAAGLVSSPGYFTPSEAFAALRAGATGLKLFPAEGATPAFLKAQLAVVPKDVPILAVGGITPDNMRPWIDAGAAGFGLGGGLYKPGQRPADTLAKARDYVAGLGQ